MSSKNMASTLVSIILEYGNSKKLISDNESNAGY